MRKLVFFLSFFILSQLVFSQSSIADNPILDLGEDFNLCTGYIHILDAGPDFDSYLWQDGSTSQTYLVTEAGVYWVHAYIGSSMYADTIQIGYWPYPDPNLGNDTTVCFGNSLILEPPNGFMTYLWQDGSTDLFYIVTQPGIYSVTVMDPHGCIGADTIIVDFSTPVDLEQDSVLICECDSFLLDAGEGFISYLWQDGSTSQYFLVDGAEYGVGSHIFSVTVVDTNDCESTDEILVYISEHVKVDEIENFVLKVYPNPSYGIVNLNLNYLPNEGYSIKIFDLQGIVVLSDEIIKTQFQNEIILDISSLKSGYYNLQIKSRTIKTQRKLIIRD